MIEIKYHDNIHILLLSLALCSCVGEDVISFDEKERIVVEGWIKEDDYPVVIVTRSVKISMESQSPQNLTNHVLNWARVAISDGERIVELMGCQDDNYFPPYIYTTVDMKGVAGKTYTLDVSFQDYHATATTTIPATVPLLMITQEKVKDNDSLYALTAVFKDPPQKDYYCLFDKTGVGSQQFTKCDVGLFDDAVFESGNDVIKLPVYHTRTIAEKGGHSEFYKEGEMVCVELCTMDRQSFEFWSDYQNSSSLSGNFFTPYSQNLRSNVHGGYGYWCGYGASSKWVKVGE